jgi:hypothetical protein
MTNWYMPLCNFFFIIKSSTLLNPHELTPFFFPSLLRKEGEDSNIQYLTPPLCVAERGKGVSSWE